MLLAILSVWYLFQIAEPLNKNNHEKAHNSFVETTIGLNAMVLGCHTS